MPPLTPKPMIYVAGPMALDPLGCVRNVTPVFDELLKAGFTPFLPQLFMVMEIVQPCDYEAMLAYDFEVIKRSDVLLRLPGESKGADREVAFAHTHATPVFTWPEERLELRIWADAWAESHNDGLVDYIIEP